MSKLESKEPNRKKINSGNGPLSLVGTFLGLALLAIALWIFSRTLRHYNLDEVVQHLKKIPLFRLGIALALACSSYLIQSIYDYIGASSLKLGIPARRAMFAAFIGNAFTNNIGFSLLTGASLRVRFYLAWGIPLIAIAQIVVLAKLAFFNGLFVFTGFMQLIAPVHLPPSLSLPIGLRFFGALLIVPTLLLFIWNGQSASETLRIGKWRIPKPELKILVGQMFFAGAHFIPAALTFYFLLPTPELIRAGFNGPWSFIGTFMAIKIAVMFLPVPGSLGVFEGTVMAVLTPGISAYPVLGALLGYRLLYYFIPFSLALLALSGYELTSAQGLRVKLMTRLKGLMNSGRVV